MRENEVPSAEKDVHPRGTIETPVGGRPPVTLRGSEDEVLPVPPTGLIDSEVAALRDALVVYSVIPTTAVDDVLAEVRAAVERIIATRVLPPAEGHDAPASSAGVGTEAGDE